MRDKKRAVRNDANKWRKLVRSRLSQRVHHWKPPYVSIDNTLLPPPPFAPTNLKQLIDLCSRSRLTLFRDCQSLHKLVAPLRELMNLVGQEELKKSIFHMVVDCVQRNQIHCEDLHMVLLGDPGMGKTTIARIVGKIVGALTGGSGHVVTANRQDLLAGYIGQTAAKTAGVINRAKGGVLLLDEASSLVPSRSSDVDSFVKASLDTLNNRLLDNPDFVCIMAGYKHDVMNNLMNVNPGLRRRFSTVIELQPYTSAEYAQMMLRMFRDKGMQLHTEAEEWLRANVKAESMKFNGGSVKRLVNLSVREARIRCFGQLQKGIVTTADLTSAWYKFLQSNKNSDDGKDLQMYT